MKTIVPAFHVILTILCLGILPKLQAVSPPPDGGYPGGNTAEGQNALFSLTSGGYNTAAGYYSLRSNHTGSFNTATGAGTLFANTADENTATGAGALLSNTSGGYNTANGAFALFNNISGAANTAIGHGALFSNTNGDDNAATGDVALYNNTTGSDNTATGDAALYSNTTGGHNTATGDAALNSNTTGPSNTAIGFQALFTNTTNGGSTATGYKALWNNTGFGNTADGYQALANNTGGNSNTALGANAGSLVTTATNVICIGASVSGTNTSDSCYIGNIFGAISNGVTSAVVINSDGKLGTISSSRRFKEEIKPMERASEALFALKPVTFRYKKGLDPQRIPQFGLVAEDVEKINQDLVVRDKEGKVNTVRYETINAMLLNEFLKEHKAFLEEQRKVQQQTASIAALKSTVAQLERDGANREATISELKKSMEAIVARLKQQDSKIQSVSAQVRINSPATQVVTSNQ